MNLLSQFSKRQDAPALLDHGEGAPIFLMMGSLSGCSQRDAAAYAKGMAERYVVSPELARYAVREDKTNGRFIYEVREGGPELSLIDQVLERLAAGEPKVRVRIVNGGEVVIEDVLGEVISLTYPAELAEEQDGLLAEEGPQVPVCEAYELARSPRLQEVFPANRRLFVAGGALLVMAFTVFMVAGAAYSLAAAGVFEPDRLVYQAKKGVLSAEEDSPAWQLGIARRSALVDGRPVHFLKRENGKWTWELKP